jgi:hypothetical protein
MTKEVKAAEKIAIIQEKHNNRNNNSKKNKKHPIEANHPEDLDINYVEELRTQLTYGDTGHGILIDKKV